jgi:hypothetical protein
MIRRFCYSNDDEVMARHMAPVNGLDVRGQDYLAGVLRPYAVRAWEDICDPRGRLRFEPDHYLKMWALTRRRDRTTHLPAQCLAGDRLVHRAGARRAGAHRGDDPAARWSAHSYLNPAGHSQPRP